MRQLSKIRDAPSPADDTDWSPMKDIFMSDVNIWNSVNLSGRREVPLYVDEPRVITFNDKDLFGIQKLFLRVHFNILYFRDLS